MVVDMIDKKTFHPLNYIKKEEYSGSMEGIALAAGGGEDVQTLEQAYFAIIEGARGYASRE